MESRKVINISRKTGESIVLTLPSGEQIELVTRRKGTMKTIVTIVAPASVRVLRKELVTN